MYLNGKKMKKVIKSVKEYIINLFFPEYNKVQEENVRLRNQLYELIQNPNSEKAMKIRIEYMLYRDLSISMFMGKQYKEVKELIDLIKQEKNGNN